jgi:pyruvate dehydrogenase E2 component (dihydrolipoamide acetyltransferase)
LFFTKKFPFFLIKINNLIYSNSMEEKTDIEAFKNYSSSNTSPFSNQSQPNQSNPQITAPQTSQATTNKSYPRHIKLNMPNLSPTVTKGKIVQWRKNEGDHVKPGEALAGIETDKAQVDFEINEKGYVAKLSSTSGAKDVNVGSARQ